MRADFLPNLNFWDEDNRLLSKLALSEKIDDFLVSLKPAFEDNVQAHG